MKTKITNAKATDLLEILTSASKQKKMPLKFCIARNIKLLQEPVKEYIEKKEELFKSAVILDEHGNGVIKKEFKETAEAMNGRVSYGFFEYESEEVQNKFFEKLKELNDTEIEFDFITEKADRVIKVSGETGEYSDSTIQAVLEDPNNEVTPALITLFLEYFLEI